MVDEEFGCDGNGEGVGEGEMANISVSTEFLSYTMPIQSEVDGRNIISESQSADERLSGHEYEFSEEELAQFSSPPEDFSDEDRDLMLSCVDICFARMGLERKKN